MVRDQNRKYLFVDIDNISKKNKRKEGNDNIDFSKLLDQYNIPKEYQKLVLKLHLHEFLSKYESEEFVTGIPFDITGQKIEKKDGKKILHIKSVNTPSIIEIHSPIIKKNYNEVIIFYKELKEKGYLNDYVKAIKKFLMFDMDLYNDIRKKSKKDNKVYKIEFVVGQKKK